MNRTKAFLRKHHLWNRTTLVRAVTLLAAIFVFMSALFLLWISSWRIPDLNSFEGRDVTQSTKIYDRTGEILLYDVYQDIKRTVVPFEKISPNIKEAVLAIEDTDFYSHKGIKITSIIRAVFANITGLGYAQGGSTITQQVVKNSLLTTDKVLSRKIKEWVLAPKLEKILTKDEIFSIYLNEIPFGGNLYGVEEATQAFFGKSSSDVTIAEAAYLAALPKAPSYYSPYGKNKAALDNRKNLVLREMLENGLITQNEYDTAKAEIVTFRPQSEFGIKAPHFVIEVREQLIQKYGERVLEEGGLRIITTLNYDLQKKAEDYAKEYATQNKKNFDAENLGLVAVDPNNGDILTMVGSRDYFDEEIQGNFNITTAHRQPGSAFKPFAFAEAFIKGYTPETVLFDLPTEFSTTCTPDGKPRSSSSNCYMPGNYDGKAHGPISMRNALAQSVNIASIKTFYLAGMGDTLKLAQNMGIQSLGNINQYGLTLVLGGGEVSLLDLTSAYGVFANDGERNPYRYILEVKDKDGNTIDKPETNPVRVMESNIAQQISDVLSDEQARAPAFGYNSPLHFAGYDVAVKTGTTNDYKDAVIVGYTPNIAIGAWAGNNDNRPMQRKIAAFIIAPFWNKVMTEALKITPKENFVRPVVEDSLDLKPVLRGKWQGGISRSTGNDNDNTISNNAQEILTGGVHDILHWVTKEDPRGPIPNRPQNDPQYENWEYAVRNWVRNNNVVDTPDDSGPSSSLEVSIISPNQNQTYNRNTRINVLFESAGANPVTRVEYYVNNELIGNSSAPFDFSFVPVNVPAVRTNRTNTLKLVFTDSSGAKVEETTRFSVN
ncbi:MAG TPA: penicillin-binding protein [Candidatus Nanoarchaeia archaeon]|nr:penicillin-binding protein [Candidatus Nanoarchaeia archaeon]